MRAGGTKSKKKNLLAQAAANADKAAANADNISQKAVKDADWDDILSDVETLSDSGTEGVQPKCM